MNIQYIHPADQIVMFMQRIYDKRLTTMSGGNLSIRDPEGNIWITPAGIDKGTLIRMLSTLNSFVRCLEGSVLRPPINACTVEKSGFLELEGDSASPKRM